MTGTLREGDTGAQLREQVLNFSSPTVADAYDAVAKACRGRVLATRNGKPSDWLITSGKNYQHRIIVTGRQLVSIQFTDFRGSDQRIQDIVESAANKAASLK